MPKILIGISILLLTLSLLFGFLNTSKVRAMHDELTTTASARDLAERARLASERKLKAGEKNFASASEKVNAAEAKASSASAELSKAQQEKSAVEAKLQASEAQIADLQKSVADAGAPPLPGSPDAVPVPNDAQAQLEDTKRELAAAEQEKSVLADKVQAAQDRVAALEAASKRRAAGANASGVHGKVLAVNEAYNFVVLSIGERQGVAANSELLVLREGTLIGRIRISSVEPTTSIGDIITNSLPRGVEVQPGDTVVYAGNTNS
jgi:DNA repair exonuclease SbcCD ATPase subunit